VKALRLHSENAAAPDAPRALRLEEVPVPQPAADELLIRVSYSGLRGGEFRRAAGAPGAASAVTLGQEFSGIVAGYGAGLSEAYRELFPVGSAITCEDTLWCGACETCRAGKLNYCDQLRTLGANREGAHAEYVAVPARACWSLQPLVDKLGLDNGLRFGALTGSYGLAYRALFADERGGAGGWLPGDRILILGGGPQGLATLDMARAAGAADVHVLEIDPSRRQTARELGASLALAPEDADSLGQRYDRVIDAAGSPELLRHVLQSPLSAGAKVELLSPADHAETNLLSASLLSQGAGIRAVQGQSGGIMERVVRMLAAGRLQPEILIRETITLEQALQRLSLQKKSEGKILVQYGNA
jgi:threonine dehydrogenase-like Zn-dependent dehydrogenase